MDDLLSIIILSYNNGEMLIETIDSVLSQDYNAVEIIICDDSSSNFNKYSIIQYIEEHKKNNIKKYLVFENKQNQGTVKNLNHGITMASGAFIKAIAGDDGIASVDVFSRQVQYLNTHPEIQFVVGNSVDCDEKMNPIKEVGFLLDKGETNLLYDYEYLLKYICRINQNALATQAICFRKEFFSINGLYDSRFRLIEDLPMAVRIVTGHVPFGYINYPCVKHRGKVGISTSNSAFDKGRLVYYEDLEKYFRLCLSPNKKVIGAIYVFMRQKVAQFRVEYCRKSPLSIIGKIKIYCKYFIPLVYYAATKSDRLLFYLGKKRTEQ